MGKYIRRRDALRILSDVLNETDPDSKEQSAVLKCSHLIEQLPAVDVAPINVKPGDSNVFVVMV